MDMIDESNYTIIEKRVTKKGIMKVTHCKWLQEQNGQLVYTSNQNSLKWVICDQSSLLQNNNGVTSNPILLLSWEKKRHEANINTVCDIKKTNSLYCFAYEFQAWLYV